MAKKNDEKMPQKRKNACMFFTPCWNMWQAVFLLLVFYLIQMALGWLDVTDDLTNPKAFLMYIFIQCGQFVLGVSLLWLFIKLLKGNLSDFGLDHLKLRYLLVGVAAGLALAIVITFISSVLAGFWGTPAPQGAAIALESAGEPWQAALLIFCIVVLVPILEEFLYRGLIYPPIRFMYGPWKAIILTALFFAGLHFDIFRFLPLWVGALGLTFLFEKTGSLWPGIFAHGTWNLFMVAVVLLQRAL